MSRRTTGHEQLDCSIGVELYIHTKRVHSGHAAIAVLHMDVVQWCCKQVGIGEHAVWHKPVPGVVPANECAANCACHGFSQHCVAQVFELDALLDRGECHVQQLLSCLFGCTQGFVHVPDCALEGGGDVLSCGTSYGHIVYY